MSNQNELPIEIYTFQDYNIRVSGTFEAPQFAAKDICTILGLTNVSEALSNIPDKWKGYQKFLTPQGEHDMLALHEPGVYKLVMRSNKPVAEKFQEWICEDVIPSIRKKGEYVLEEYKKKLEEQQKALDSSKVLLEKKDEHIRKLQREKQVIEGYNCVYLATAEGKEAEGIYTIGQTTDIKERLKQYNDNKLFQFKMSKYISCKSVKLMDAIETILLAKLNRYKIVSNRDVFQLPEGKDLSFFTQWYDYIEKFCEDIEEGIELQERAEEEKQELLSDKLQGPEYKKMKSSKDKRYCEKHKEKLIVKHKEYRENNKDQIKQTKKEYYEKNAEKVIEKSKDYYEKYKDKVLEKVKKYANEHKKDIKDRSEKYKQQKITCECGTTFIKYRLKLHLESKFHQDFLEAQKTGTPIKTSEEKERELKEIGKTKVICECKAEITKNCLLKHLKSKMHLDLMNLQSNNVSQIDLPSERIHVKKELSKRKKAIVYEKSLTEQQCECGSTYIKCGKSRHIKTEKHQNFLKTLPDVSICVGDGLSQGRPR